MRKFGTDMAVPVDRFREMFAAYREGLRDSGLENMTWGHIGDAHLHVNILPRDPEEADVAAHLFDRFVRQAIALGGTISAEHGVGKLKRNYLHEMYGDGTIRAMAQIKRHLDPSGLLGRGTMFEEGVGDQGSGKSFVESNP
jgi:D-lactate dehydrogenase (cytochrome)